MGYKVLAAALVSFIFAGSPAASQNAQSNSSASKAGSPAQERTYCLSFNSDTGSHIARTECKTKKEWRRAGIDIDELIGR